MTEPETFDATCPQCGGHHFRLYVQQRIFVEFTEDGSHQVYDGPEGDMEFDDDTEAFCENDECGHFGPLGEMK